uniref:exodeoxyribonuclease III n=1 Tax=Acanthochromis polyacanthus TaxID=80966 RepID=A0A3Q1G7L0_9TELE
MVDVLKFLSWNVKGANVAIKRKKLLLYLKQKKVDVCFLQETHLDNEESTKLQRDWVSKIFYSAYSSSQRGVCILLHKNVNITIHNQLSDREGRWVAIILYFLRWRWNR